MKVFLLSINPVTVPYPVYPLGIEYVAGALSDRHQVHLADLNAMPGESALADLLRTFRPDVVGLSIRNVDTTDIQAKTSFLEPYRQAAAQIRHDSSATLVLGGSGFTIFPDELLADLGADYGIVGEGERLDLLLEDLEKGREPTAIDGLVAPDRPAAVPPPWRRGVNRRFNPRAGHIPYYLARGGMLNLQTQRGCPYQCIYCTYPHIEGHELRLFDPEDVAQMALDLQSAGARFIYVTDAVFNANYAHAMAVAEAFLQAGLKVPWGAYFTPTRAPQGFFRLMRRAGLSHVEFGTEALNDEMLTIYRKPFDAGQVFSAHERALTAGLNVAHFLLMGGPGETPLTLAQTLDNIDKLQHAVLFFFVGVRVYPHTRLYQIARDRGQIDAQQSLLSPIYYQAEQIRRTDIVAALKPHTAGRADRIVGGGDGQTVATLTQLYKRGLSGPLWEHRIKK
jgi:radical SAM superfamily enzyme YgiQ (UPF0313 family)